MFTHHRARENVLLSALPVQTKETAQCAEISFVCRSSRNFSIDFPYVRTDAECMFNASVENTFSKMSVGGDDITNAIYPPPTILVATTWQVAIEVFLHNVFKLYNFLELII